MVLIALHLKAFGEGFGFCCYCCYFGVTPSGAQRLFPEQHSDITPDGAQETIGDAGDKLASLHARKCPTCCTISLTCTLQF